MSNGISGGGLSNTMDWLFDKIMIIPGIVIGLSMHEFAHAFVAHKLGDNTPMLQGRVTINPAAHIDIIGLIALFFCGFGWGRPVEINPFNFRNRRRDQLLVSLAGVVMNLIMAILFVVVIKVLLVTSGAAVFNGSTMGQGVMMMLYYIVQINLVLMIFNLIPCPPLDGFNILAQIGGFGQTDLYWKLYNYGNWLLIALIVFNITSMIISPCVSFFMNLFMKLLLI
ncbi:MAG: site-2 protease family protein [Bacillota bacterium]|nr:site-2 protease family protein [Bacillota bacterium]